MNFQDAEFMTAQEKQALLKQWEIFLKNGLKKAHFSKRIYDHLHLHCGFIAHYNIHGFYSTYFESRADTQRFFDSLFNYPYTPHAYEDINFAMRLEYEKYESQIRTETQNDIVRKIALLKASVDKAATDPEFAIQLLTRLNL
jgi:hypothetical protein